jgi:YD repeat-containing protein
MLNQLCRISLLLLLAFAAAVNAGQERYDYDALGRLIRYINPAGEATEYVYDAVGNILAVRRIPARPPQITNVPVDSVRQGTPTTVTVSGTDLLGATVITTVDGIHITDLQSTATGVTFLLTVDDGVTLGPQPFTISSSTGSVGFNLNVQPALPRIIVTPSPVVLAPGETANLRVSLSNADQKNYQLALTIGDPSVATLSATALDFPAGQTEATVNVTAVGHGSTFVDLTAAALAPVKSGIYISENEPPGDRMRIAKSVGVVRQVAPPAPPPVGPFTAHGVGVFRQTAPPAPPPVGPFTAHGVGVVRESQAATPQPIGPFIAPEVGVLRGN